MDLATGPRPLPLRMERGSDLGGPGDLTAQRFAEKIQTWWARIVARAVGLIHPIWRDDVDQAI